jgi:hypothetical protein
MQAEAQVFEDRERARPVLRRQGTEPASAATSSCSGAPSRPCLPKVIPFKILSFQELGLPPVVGTKSRRQAPRPRAHARVRRARASRRRSRALVDKINVEKRHDHILTIEDPIEYLHPTQGLRGQPARGRRGHGAASRRRCKYVLRQDPDVVLIGELRDLETIEAGARDQLRRVTSPSARCTPTARSRASTA